MKRISYVNSCTPVLVWPKGGEESLYLSRPVTARGMKAGSVKKGIREWHSVSRGMGGGRIGGWPLRDGEASASPSLWRPPHLVDTGAVGNVFWEDSPSLHSISFYLAAHLPPLPPPPECHLTSLTPLPTLRLCRPLLNRMDCRCAVSPREEDLLPPTFQFAVIYPPHPSQKSMHKLCIRGGALWSSDLS